MALDQKQIEEIVNAFSSKVDEKIEARMKAVNFSETAENKAKLDATKKLSDTGEFLKALISGDNRGAIEISKKSWGANYTKALNTTTDAAIVPTEFSTEVIKSLPTFSVIRQDARVRGMSSKTVDLNELTTRVTAGKVAELTNATASKPVYTARTVTAEDYFGLSVMSMQLEQDNEIDILADLRDEFARAIARVEQISFLNSAVVGAEGIMTASGTSVYVLGGGTTSGRDSFLDAGADDIEKASAELRQLNVGVSNPKLYASADVLAAISAKVVSNVGYQEAMKIQYVNGQIARIAGVEVREVTGAGMLPDLGDDAVTTDFAFIADLNNSFVIGDRMGIEMKVIDQGEVVDETSTTINLNMTGGKALRAIKRTGQKVVRPAEIFKLRTSTT